MGHIKHCRAVTSFLLRFLSPVRGTERDVKPIVAWLECGALLQERRRGRKAALRAVSLFFPLTALLYKSIHQNLPA